MISKGSKCESSFYSGSNDICNFFFYQIKSSFKKIEYSKSNAFGKLPSQFHCNICETSL